ncbi:MAG: hypothetical protein HYR95_01390 [Candidatus Colwellbacteria bacterium]|nr:hypothetical protein [Candidatus Colwellbacteria bacterium]
MTTRIKADKTKSIIEIEGEEKFVERIYNDFVKEPLKQDYTAERTRISIILSLLIPFLLVLSSDNNLFLLFSDSKVFIGFAIGFVGLLTRNTIFMSGSIPEKSGKRLWLAYLAYSLFIIASSLLIYGVLSIYPKSIEPHLFYAFLLPLNFYIGLMTYSVIEFFDRISKLFK